jgi:GT2 family glycosyltransferase
MTEQTQLDDRGVCAVVVTCNRKDLLRESLAALLSQTVPLTGIVVVDNASTDGTFDLLQREFPHVEALRLTQNVGGAGGFYIGMQRAYAKEGEWLWLLDDDTIATPTALEELLRAERRFNLPERPVLLASKVLWTDGSLHYMNPSRAKVGDLEKLYLSVAQATLSIRSSTFVSCLIRREAVTRYGFPLADYFIWGDDTEYTARLLRDNFGLMVPASVVIHKTAKKHTALDAPPERYYYHVRNFIWMMTRSTAWTGKERLSLAVTLCAWIARYLRITKFRWVSVKVVIVAIFHGLLAGPKEMDLESLVERREPAVEKQVCA